MAETPYNHYALYEPDASPDLTATGEYNSAVMAIDSDMHAEETERAYADKQLSDRITTLGNQEIADVRDLNAKILAEEMNRVSADSGLATDIDNEKKARTNYDALIEREYKAADTALGKRIDNAEVEISANSADLTGIKSLTYGNEHVQFLENDNGSYSSPALDEIAEQMTQRMTVIQIPVGATTIDTANLNKLSSDWPNVALLETGTDPLANGPIPIYFPYAKDGSDYLLAPIVGQYSEEGKPYALGVSIAKTGEVSRLDIENDPYWKNIQLKPFSTIGRGLKVYDDALMLDESALPSNVTIMQLSEFGVLTYDAARPYSATGNGNAAAYAKLQKAWPNVVVVDGSSSWTGGMYAPAAWTQIGYALTKSTITNTGHSSPVEMTIGGSGYSDAVRLREITATGITPGTQWGTIEG